MTKSTLLRFHALVKKWDIRQDKFELITKCKLITSMVETVKVMFKRIIVILLVPTFVGRKFRVLAFFSHFCETKSPRNLLAIRESLFNPKYKKNEIRELCQGKNVFFTSKFTRVKSTVNVLKKKQKNKKTCMIFKLGWNVSLVKIMNIDKTSYYFKISQRTE